jgi:hypothetical protein
VNRQAIPDTVSFLLFFPCPILFRYSSFCFRSSFKMTRSKIEAALAAAIDADSATGIPWWPSSEMASIAFRRWSSFARRHKKTKRPTFDDRVVDLEKGLRSHYEPEIPYSPPGEWLRLSRLLAATLAEHDT